jgi:hypothetical protein
MRHVAATFLESTLRRGKPLEQLLGGLQQNGERSIRWLELRPVNASVEIWDFVALDIGDAEHLDLYGFIGAEEGLLVERFSSPAEALSYAQAHLGAARHRWVNQSVVQIEYHDFIMAGRPEAWPNVVV